MKLISAIEKDSVILARYHIDLGLWFIADHVDFDMKHAARHACGDEETETHLQMQTNDAACRCICFYIAINSHKVQRTQSM